MSIRGVAAGLIVFLCGAAPAPAQTVSLEFQNGQVRLVAENAPVSQILAEWSRLGGTKIVNGERIAGAPVTLQLVDVAEQQALDVVLRGVAGYMVAGRDVAAARASVFDRILVLPTAARAPITASLPPPPQAPPGAPDDVDEENLPPRPAQVLPAGGQPVIRLPQGRVLPGAEDQQAPPEEAVPAQNTPTSPVRANPFGVTTGSSRPGTIAPVTRPRNPNEPSPDR